MTDRWVELRVHGVSGAAPESLLDRPHVRQVDGDDKSRFFRAVDAADHVIDAGDGHAVEGFHWGHYTSGSWRQAFWLALLPFGLINAAAFMLPSPHRADGSTLPYARMFRVIALASLRFLALLLTILLSFATSLALIDIVGSRWAAKSALVPGWFAPAVPSAAVILSALAVMILGGAAWVSRMLGHRSSDAGLAESLRPTPSGTDSVQTTSCNEDGGTTTPFATTEFYQGDTDTLTLRGLHVAAGLTVPAFMGLSFAKQGTAGAGVLIGVIVVITVLLGDVEKAATTGLDAPAPRWVDTWHQIAGVFSALAVAVGTAMVGWAAYSVFGSKRPDTSVALDTFLIRYDLFDQRAANLLYAGVIGLIVLAVAVVGLSFSTREMRASTGYRAYFRPYSKGATTIPVAALAVFLGVGFSAAAVIGTATLLSERTGSRRAELGITLMLDRVAYAWGLAVFPALVVVIVLVVQRVRSRRALADRALIGYPGGSAFPPDRLASWRRALSGAVWSARVKNGIEPILWTLVGAASVLSAALLAEMIFGDLPGAAGYLSRQTSDGRWAELFTQLGTWVLLGLIVGLVLLARGAFRDASTRRAVNIVWDVIAFWPHAVHPFIPAPYSQRAVGDLAERIRHHAAASTDGGRAIIVCGHSQGSLVSFAAVNLLSDDECSRVGLLTFGSQLRVMFARAFPLYVNADAIAHTYDRLDGAWVNLYRDTDPLAGPVLSWNHSGEGADARSGHFPDPDGGARPDPTVGPYRTRRSGSDWRLVDPVPRIDPLQAAPVNALLGHGAYWSNPEWHAALYEVRTRPRTQD